VARDVGGVVLAVKSYNYKSRPRQGFNYDDYPGSTVDISFDIISETEMGTETLRFDTVIRYFDTGECGGDTLLLVHGIGQSLFTWRHSIDYFADNGYRVIAMDLAGCGYSGHPNIYFTVEENALVIGAFLDAMGIKRAHIAAFSTGALSALCYAHEHPQRVDRLVLVSPGGPNENYPFSLRMLTTWLGRTIFLAYLGEASVHNILSGLYFDATQLRPEVVSGYYLPLRHRDVRETLVMMMMQFDDAYVKSLLKGIRHHTLVFSAAEDKLHREDIIRDYALIIPGAEHIRLRNCGHLLHEEKAERFNEATRAFLKKQYSWEDEEPI
jgi:pimeloyl-ACP methyl ester carboxylesterase